VYAWVALVKELLIGRGGTQGPRHQHAFQT
jgi:hypothetical protein